MDFLFARSAIIYFMRRLQLFILISIGAVLVASFSLRGERLVFFADVRDFLASVFFVDSSSVPELQKKYTSAKNGFGKVTLVVFPGHDDDSPGTAFKGVREADMTAKLGEELARLFEKEGAFNVFLARNSAGYNPVFLHYLETQRGAIEAFIDAKKYEMKQLIDAGLLHSYVGVVHNNAAYDTARKLYGINKWANDNGADLVIHIHFNDYPGRKLSSAGTYDGFSIYVPEKQYSNAKASKVFASSVFNRLEQYYPSSNLPKERVGIVEDQELIAIGSYNTLDAAGILVEYGYIYEAQFTDAAVRDRVIRELAFQTYLGIKDFLGDPAPSGTTSFLPYTWETTLREGIRSEAVLALQAALVREAAYPPRRFSKRDCPLSGRFGGCTGEALRAFQEKHAIPSERGYVGETTRKKLNELYGK